MDYQVGYVWSDGKIITQSLGLIVRGTSGGNPTETQINIDSKYVYEEGSNTPYAAMFMNSEYLLVKNAQGDVTAVVDSRNGETLVEYEYDPWGQVTSTYCGPDDDEITKNLIMTIVNAVCPLTYRGYNYDFTTGLYYLQSRYYNPEWGRFLNVDDVKILATSAGDPLAANPYLYCNNNPVNRVDYTGNKFLDNSAKAVKVNVYEGFIGHSEIVLSKDLIFSYGIYHDYNRIDSLKGTQGTMLIIYNEVKWYQYDRQNNDNRTRVPYTFYLDEDQYIALLIFYMSFIFLSDIEESSLGYIDKCKMTSGPYSEYRLLSCNCTTVIRDALLFAASGKVLRACYMGGLSFPNFAKVYKPDSLMPYMDAMSKYC